MGYWNDARITLLKISWGIIPASEIANLIDQTCGPGPSSDAVIGKANRLGLPPISKALCRQWRIERHGKATAHKFRGQAIDDVTTAKMVRLYLDHGLSIGALHERFGFSHGHISATLKGAGVNLHARTSQVVGVSAVCL